MTYRHVNLEIRFALSTGHKQKKKITPNNSKNESCTENIQNTTISGRTLNRHKQLNPMTKNHMIIYRIIWEIYIYILYIHIYVYICMIIYVDSLKLLM